MTFAEWLRTRYPGPMRLVVEAILAIIEPSGSPFGVRRIKQKEK